ncbi:acyl-CoA dehydrogenase family protein [Pseudonocardia ailaonensis]|uniref:Acyl-CoA dehydrogenase family protein n=1 Tax=Pseudonocardia ailaonensis TaxID=367279 RepID=A0ABN2MJ14_9PSEU
MTTTESRSEDDTAADEQAVSERITEFLADVAARPADKREIWARQFDAGLAWVDFPVGFGGMGVGRGLRALVTARLRAAGIRESSTANGIGVSLTAPLLVSHGTEEQRRRHLRPLFTGEEICCQLFSEPGAGSDLAALATTAQRTDTGYVVNGQKVWTTLAHVSTWGLLIARTNPDVPKHAGLSMFLVDMSSAGITPRPIREMTGDADFNEVFLEDVEIPAESLIGTEGGGWSAVVSALANERAVFSTPLPRGGGEIAEAVDLWKRFGAGRPELRDRYTRLWARAEALRLAEARAIASEEPGIVSPAWSYFKLLRSELSQQVYSFCLTLTGPEGLEYGSYAMRRPETSEDMAHSGDVSRSFLFARCKTIAAGTSEVQRTIVADRVLRLPREPQVDRNTPWRDLRKG